MDKTERLRFWEKEKMRDDAFINSSFERATRICNALNHPKLSALYGELENMARCYLLREGSSPYCWTKHCIKGCVRLFGDYAAEGIWECHESISITARRYYLSQRLCNALQQWSWWYECMDSINFERMDGQKTLSPQETEAYMLTGCRLACEVKRQAPQCKVLFYNEYGLPDFPVSVTWLEIIFDDQGNTSLTPSA